MIVLWGKVNYHSRERSPGTKDSVETETDEVNVWKNKIGCPHAEGIC